MASQAGFFNFLKSRRLHADDVKSAATWGVAAGAGALWIVQPFNWIKKTFLDKPEPEK